MNPGNDIRNQPKVELLFEENIDTFNRLVAQGRPPDLRGRNLSGLDLRRAHLKGLNLAGAYLRGANLSGVDLSGCNLFGASMNSAKISGAFFPENVSAEEIRFSVEYGTRIRTSPYGRLAIQIKILLLKVIKKLHLR